MEAEKNKIPVGAMWSNPYHLCPDGDFDNDAEEMSFTLYKGRSEKNQEMCSFTAPYRRNGMDYDVSEDGRQLIISYPTKYGLVMRLTDTGEILWQNKKYKKVKKVRFNQNNPEIIEAIRDDLEILYLYSSNGEPVSEEDRKNVIQGVNDFYCSLHRKKLLTVDCSCTDKSKAWFTVYDCEEQTLQARFVGPYSIGGSRAAVTDDGKYVACAAWTKEGIALVETESGTTLWKKTNITRIQSVQFSKDESQVIIRTNEDEVYFLDREDGSRIKKLSLEDYYVNIYHSDIEQKSEKELRKENQSYVRTKNACHQVVCTKQGIVAKCRPGGLFFYDYQGELLWQSKGGSDIAYIEDTDTIQYFIFDERQQYKGELLVLSAADGTIRQQFDWGPEDVYLEVYIGNYILCRNGSIYDANGSELVKVGVFPFRIQ